MTHPSDDLIRDLALLQATVQRQGRQVTAALKHPQVASNDHVTLSLIDGRIGAIMFATRAPQASPVVLREKILTAAAEAAEAWQQDAREAAQGAAQLDEEDEAFARDAVAAYEAAEAAWQRGKQRAAEVHVADARGESRAFRIKADGEGRLLELLVLPGARDLDNHELGEDFLSTLKAATRAAARESVLPGPPA